MSLQPIIAPELEEMLRPYEGEQVYLHIEVTPGAFARNMQARIERIYVAGVELVRVALKLPDGGWIRVEGLTHYALDTEGRLLLAGHDEKGRLTTALELSRQPFPA